jgi:hypothetical protein
MAKRKIKKTVTKKKEPNWKALFFVALFAFVGVSAFTIYQKTILAQVPPEIYRMFKIGSGKFGVYHSTYGQTIPNSSNNTVKENSSYVKGPSGNYVWSEQKYLERLWKDGKLKNDPTKEVDPRPWENL